jgi:glycosyltransferase involved in cell wall biosynthesis
VPGCIDFIRDGVEGYVVAVDAEDDLQSAILKLLSDRETLVLLGKNARERTLATSTAKKIQSQYEEIFRFDCHCEEFLRTTA